ncbi:GntR family transcriptional regulator [Streptomyces abyssalis]|uniref:GntR family transcriptional regulator n=1 Tax=Streptomyces abyssalis TaxID=933944 RepID=A0A1E7JP95_9ACTN|nr:GntR family transcriptional regulator [Streptomyces abyssalis]OEU86509.1 GntR family transcriptional regulator [Streptomyces abyssalis]OEU90101.1 GntR family transcriptional regulator [Streptomyces abyssalis]OEV29068.1 GntR family transcriptional regulator [Streptomyces nanshensis]
MTTRDGATGSRKPAGPARERVYDWLRDEIIKGSLEGGQFLDEQWVSRTVGVSRTPVREAFHRLAAEHFIQLMPRKGAQVRSVTARELEEVYQARRLIEGHAARSLCEARHGAPGGMTALLEPMERAGRERDWFEVAALNRQFHEVMVSTAGNSVITDLYEGLHSRQQRVGLRAMRARPERVGTVDAEHRALVAALDAFDAERALAVLDEHLRPVPEVVSVLPRGTDG